MLCAFLNQEPSKLTKQIPHLSLLALRPLALKFLPLQKIHVLMDCKSCGLSSSNLLLTNYPRNSQLFTSSMVKCHLQELKSSTFPFQTQITYPILNSFTFYRNNDKLYSLSKFSLWSLVAPLAYCIFSSKLLSSFST